MGLCQRLLDIRGFAWEKGRPSFSTVCLCCSPWIIFQIASWGSVTIPLKPYLWFTTTTIYLFSSSPRLLESDNNDQKPLEPPAHTITWRWHWRVKDLQSNYASAITTLLHQRFMKFVLLLFFNLPQYHVLSLYNGWSLSRVLSSLICLSTKCKCHCLHKTFKEWPEQK